MEIGSCFSSAERCIQQVGAARSPGTSRPRSPTDLETRLERLTRSRAPLRRALARIAGRIVEARSWERLGFARLADYARERAGLSARQVQDLAHVDGRLAALPWVEAAFLAGELTWTKTRLLARVAERGNEASWVAFARGVTARSLEREVRAVDRGALEGGGLEMDEDGGSAEEKEYVIVRCSSRVQGKFHRARWVARRVAGEDLPPWACMEAVAAEALSALGVDGSDTADDGASEEQPGDVDWLDRSPSDLAPYPALRGVALANVCAPQASPAPPPEVEELLLDLEAADPFELDTRLRHAVALEQRVDAELAPLLRRAFEARNHRSAGFSRFDSWARECLGLSPRKARALLRLDRAAAKCPPLSEAFASARVSWVQAQVLLPLLSFPEAAEFRAPWVSWTEQVSVRRLQENVDAALLLLETERETFLAGGGLPERQTCAHATRPAEDAPPAASTPANSEESQRFMFLAPRPVARLFRAVLCSVQRHLERSSGRSATSTPTPSLGLASEWMFDHAFETWGANEPRVAREHRVFERDGWRCTVPGCTSHRNLHDHHIVFRSAGGSDALANRTTLCAWHHLRGVHENRVRCRGSAPAGLRFELGLRPDKPPLLAYTAGERLAAPRFSSASPSAAQRAAGSKGFCTKAKAPGWPRRSAASSRL
jgi:hypothetical protein